MTTQPLYRDFKVKELPPQEYRVADARYVVKVDGEEFIREWITDANGNAYPHKTDEAAKIAAEAARDAAIQSALFSQEQSIKAQFDADRAGAAYANLASHNGEATSFSRLLDPISALFDGVRLSFPLTLSGQPVYPLAAPQLLVLIGGSLQVPGDGFAISDSTISFPVAPISGLRCSILELMAYTDNVAYALSLKADQVDLENLSASVTSELATKASTESVSASVSSAVAALVNSAPGTLDTLGEIAAAIASDQSAAAVLSSTVGGKLTKSENLADLPSPGTARANLGLGIYMLDSIESAFSGALTTFDLFKGTAAYFPKGANHLNVILGGVRQTGCTVSGSTITFASAPASGLPCVIYAIEI